MDIDKILLKIMNDQAGKEEYEALEAWKNESQENIAQLQQIIQSKSNEGSPYRDYDKHKAWKKIEVQMEPMQPAVPQKSKSIKTPLLLLLAALVACAAYYFLKGDKVQEPTLYEAQAEQQNFALQDASQIWLRRGGTNLEILSDFDNDNERRVRLDGEAFFDIAKNPSKPFIIELGNEEFIKVLGTSFNVINKGKELNISVYSGTVVLHTLGRELTLKKGDKASRVMDAIVLNKNIDSNETSWKSKELTFDDTALSQVFDAISRHYMMDIELDKESTNLVNCRVRERFTDQTIDSVLSDLSKNLDFNYELDDQKITISNLSCR